MRAQLFAVRRSHHKLMPDWLGVRLRCGQTQRRVDQPRQIARGQRATDGVARVEMRQFHAQNPDRSMLLNWSWIWCSTYVMTLGFVFLGRFCTGRWKTMSVIHHETAPLPETHP